MWRWWYPHRCGRTRSLRTHVGVVLHAIYPGRHRRGWVSRVLGWDRFGGVQLWSL